MRHTTRTIGALLLALLLAPAASAAPEPCTPDELAADPAACVPDPEALADEAVATATALAEEAVAIAGGAAADAVARAEAAAATATALAEAARAFAVTQGEATAAYATQTATRAATDGAARAGEAASEGERMARHLAEEAGRASFACAPIDRLPSDVAVYETLDTHLYPAVPWWLQPAYNDLRWDLEHAAERCRETATGMTYLLP